MNGFELERARPWNFYSDNPSPSQTISYREPPFRNLGTSVNAISFGFVATAVLISIFLILAIFEHLLRPRSSSTSTLDAEEGSPESGTIRAQMHLHEKLSNPQTGETSHSSDFSVVMPGQHYPTFIAQAAPLPCSREGIYRPYHDHGFTSS